MAGPDRRRDPPRPEAAETVGAPKTARPRGRPAAALVPPDYFRRTRNGPVNLVFLMPWILVYVLCWWIAGDSVETQAAAWLRTGLRLLGPRALFTVTVVVALGLCAVVLARLEEARGDAPVFPLMMAEGALYGVLLYGASVVLSRFVPVGRWLGLAHGPAALRPVAALGTAVGAGIFEELVFRGVVCFGLYRALNGVLGADRWTSGAISVVGAAFLFAAYHHVGPGGEPWDALRFTFRLHAGALLGVVFLSRGLGIAAFAHGFYDALVLFS